MARSQYELGILAERERCAGIAAEYKYDGYNDDDAAWDIRNMILGLPLSTLRPEDLEKVKSYLSSV